ncbi:MAG: DUF1501 domain-containing protein [Phycisphaera sp.]|nr:DUF1501 domain-containing protein [Phycisphaera sp.]
MFEIRGTQRSHRYCDGVTRRSLLRAGAVGLAGLTLADERRRTPGGGSPARQRSIINIHLDGGPPQMDTIDLKPDAPSEIRGDFNSIPTSIPGFHVCELMPKIAKMADRFSYLRTVVGSIGQHHAFQTQSGWDEKSLKAFGGRPAMGCVLNRLLGHPTDPAPTYVDMMQGRGLARNSCRPGYLGPAYAPFRPDLSAMFTRELEDGMKTELANLGRDHTTSLKLIHGVTADRLNDRRELTASLDSLKQRLDSSREMDAMDRFTQQAISILTSGRFAEALDLSREDPKIVAMYTPHPDRVERFATSEAPEGARKLLLARRLVEAGVRCVSVSISDFDTHSDNFTRMRQVLPILDTGLSALVTDLEQRGMLDDVTVVVWGEFGRTPKINKNAGRDHWPRVSPAIITGGGLNRGVIIGETDRYAGEVVSRPVDFQEVFATLYHTLGIDPGQVAIEDVTGRPHYLLDRAEPIRELL